MFALLQDGLTPLLVAVNEKKEKMVAFLVEKANINLKQGDLVIHPIQTSRGTAFMQVLQGFDEEFIHFIEQEQQEPLPLQEREML